MILLTHGYFLPEDKKEQATMKPYVPLGILYISSYLEKHGIPNEVFDSTFSTFEALTAKIVNQQPSIIGIYTNLMTKLNVIRIMDVVKLHLPSCKIVLGGPEIRYYHEEYLKAGADIVVFGEGEITMHEICDHFNLTGELPTDAKGTALFNLGSLLVNPERELLRNLDELPLPARHKIDLNAYLKLWKERHGMSMLSVSTMRGCPYTCKWCSRAVYGGTYRRRSPAHVVEELIRLKETYSPDAIWFVDDVFTISHKWLREFSALMTEKKVDLPYEIITRADRMNEEVISLLKSSGCFRVWIGAESGSQSVIDKMDRRVKVEQVREMIALSKNYGIETGTFIMLGYPGEEFEDIRLTIDHLVLSAPDQYTITLAYPIKGTPLYSEVSDEIVAEYDFRNNTDRDIRFRRNYSETYYSYALRWVYNSVNAHRERRVAHKLRDLLKARVARFLMELNK